MTLLLLILLAFLAGLALAWPWAGERIGATGWIEDRPGVRAGPIADDMHRAGTQETPAAAIRADGSAARALRQDPARRDHGPRCAAAGS